MQMMTTPQRPSYKGNMHLRVRPHVGVIALGNALGNAIVGKMSQPPKLSQEENDAILKRGREIFAQGAKDLSDKGMKQLQDSLDKNEFTPTTDLPVDTVGTDH